MVYQHHIYRYVYQYSKDEDIPDVRSIGTLYGELLLVWSTYVVIDVSTNVTLFTMMTNVSLT